MSPFGERVTLFIVCFITLCMACQDESTIADKINVINTKTFDGRTENFKPHRNLYFGDLHIHTSWSFDAFMTNVRVSPDEAYRFGKGEAIQHVSGKMVQMQRPLDFMAVSDHAEYMGALMQMFDKDHPFHELNISKNLRSDKENVQRKARRNFRISIALNRPYSKLIKHQDLKSTWRRMVEIADAHNEPGKFTTFPAYEWTSSVGVLSSLIKGPAYAQNLHRNVIYKGGNVSTIPFSSFDSQNPQELWEWMEIQRNKGIELLAIPHNANISDGRMYALEDFGGRPMTKQHVETRLRNEPVNEVVQLKGQSMSHPDLATNDEFADFEVYEYALGASINRKELSPDGAYARQALKNGLKVKQELRTNPFQFGLIGSSDSHNGGSNVEEDNNIGKSGTKDPTPQVRMREDIGGTINRRSSVAGLAAVWATENTREAIYEALERKEVYATSGPRIGLRFFALEDGKEFDLDHPKLDSMAYQHGHPMGSLIENKTASPLFLIKAFKDVEGAKLDRVQIVKGWLDKEGLTHEKIYNVAWSDDRTLTQDGQLPPVGNTVDTITASYKNTIGAVQFTTYWRDPDFSAVEAAFYYGRVLEIPTPRWTTFDAIKLGIPLPEDVPYSLQERAWSSPIWYQPAEKKNEEK